MKRRDFLKLLGLPACGGLTEMATHGSPLHVQLLPGIRQDVAPEMAPVGTLAQAVNVRYGKTGGIYPRSGTSNVPIANPGTTFVLQDSGLPGANGRVGSTPVLGADGRLWAFDSVASVWNYSGLYSTCQPVRKRNGLTSNQNNGFGKTRYGIAVNSAGYLLLASSDGTDVHWFIEDPTGTRIRAGRETGTRCVAFSTGASLYLIVQNGTELTGVRLTVAAGVVTRTTGSVGTLTGSAANWDAHQGTSEDSWYLVHQDGASQITLSRFGTLTSADTTTESVTGTVGLAVYADANRVWLSWHDDPTVSGEVFCRVYDSATLDVESAITELIANTNAGPMLFGPMPSSLPSAVTFVVMVQPSASAPRMIYGRADAALTVLDPVSISSDSAWNVVPFSKPDSGQRVWCMSRGAEISGQVNRFQRPLLLRFIDSVQAGVGVGLMRPVVELIGPESVRQNTGLTVPDNRYFFKVAESSGLMFAALPFVLRADTTHTLYTLELYEYETLSRNPYRVVLDLGSSCVVSGQPVEFFGASAGNATNTSGTLLSAYDGGAEVGFFARPVISSLTEGNSGSLTAEGTYSFVAVYEWWDMYGRVHQSAPSVPASITLTGANDDVTVAVSSLGFGQRTATWGEQDPVVHVYRTVNAGETYHRNTTATNTAPSAVDQTDGTVAYVSTATDSAIEGREALYTDGGVSEYSPAPSCRFLWRDDRRVWFGGLWEQDEVQCSLDSIPYHPVECSDRANHYGPIYRVRVHGAVLTAGTFQDGTNFLFTASAIYGFVGDGPDRSGVGEFSKPRLITDEAGCINHLSVLATSAGIMFQSKRGLELMPRGGGRPIFVGAAVQDIVASYPYCRRAVLHVDRNGRQARFLMTAEPTGQAVTASRVLVYDLDIAGQGDPRMGWSEDVVLGVVSNTSAQVADLGAWPSGTFAALENLSGNYAGVLDGYGTALSLDASGALTYTTTVRTNHIRPFGPAGFGRCQNVTVLYSDPSGADTLAMRVYTDSEYKEKSWTLSNSAGSHYRQLTPGTPTQNQQCSSIEVLLTLTRPVPGGTIGPAVHSLTIDLKAEPGAKRLETEKQ